MKKSKFNVVVGCLRREILRYLKDPIGAVLDAVFSNLLFCSIFYIINPERISLIFPGVILMSCFSSAFSNYNMVIFIGKLEKTINYQLAAPISRTGLYFIYMLATTLRNIIISGAMLVAANLLFQLPRFVMAGIASLFFLFCSFSFCAISAVISLFLKNWNSVGVVNNYVLSPILYLSGAFFILKDLPVSLQKIIPINPFFHFVNSFRYFCYGILDYNLAISLICCITLTIFAFVLGICMFSKGYKLLN